MTGAKKKMVEVVREEVNVALAPSASACGGARQISLLKPPNFAGGMHSMA